jgi:enoyl-CoA hydratase/carnithine racemase
MKLERDGDVYVLDFGGDENRLNPDFSAEYRDALATVEATAGPRALVATGSGKFWSNGLDLDWMSAHPDDVAEFMRGTYALWADILQSSAPTVAAIQGHAFGAGAMLALAHDQRTMRADRGYFCFPEVAILRPFSPQMAALIMAKLSRPVAHHAMTTGQRYGGADAAAAAIVDEAAGPEGVLARAVERAAGLAGNDPATLRTIKQVMYRDALAALTSA